MKKNSLNDKLIAVVRIRGRVNVRSDIAETLKRLHLKRVNNCTVVKVTSSYGGMLNRCNNYVAYGEIDEDTLKKMIERNGLEIDPKELIAGKYNMQRFNSQMPFRLHPPRHGYKSTKLNYKQGGSLGYMGKEINKLIQRMV